MNKKDLKTSLIIALSATFLLMGFWFSFSKLSLGYDPTIFTKQILKKDSAVQETLIGLVGTDTTWRLVVGTTSVTFVGTSTDTTLPRIEFDGLTGLWKIKGLSGTETEKIGTITADYLTTLKVQYLADVDENIGAHFTFVETTMSTHAHGGTDSVRIDHDNLTNKGTQTHENIDNFIASKAQASGIASLDANSLVVQNPASGTSTPGIAKIPISLGTGFIDDSWLSSTITKLGGMIELGAETTGNTDNISEGSTNKYYTDARVNAAVGSLSVNQHNDVNITFNEGDFVKIQGGQLVSGSSSTSVNYSDITGVPTDNGTFSGKAAAGKIPVGSTTGRLDTTWIPTELILDTIQMTGTTTEAAANGNWQVRMIDSVIEGVSGVVLLAHFNGAASATAFVDSSQYANNGTATGNAQLDTTQKQFGSASLLLDGKEDHAGFADAEQYTIGTQSFQIDAHIWLNSTAENGAILSLSDGDNTNNMRFVFNGGGSQGLEFVTRHEGVLTDIVQGNTSGWSTGTWTWVRVSRASGTSTVNLYRNGVLLATGSNSTNFKNYSSSLLIGNSSIGEDFNGRIDEVRFLIGNNTALETPTEEYGRMDTYIQHKYKLYAPDTGTEILTVQTPGTATTEASYFLLNGSGTVIGAGTTTGITGTPNAYALYVEGASLAESWQVTSTKEKKENIKKLGIKKEWLDAEAIAKENYIISNKPAWLIANEANYTYVGSNSATYVDTEAMDADYANYIEIAWAADGSQTYYIDSVQKESEKLFWQTFDSIQSKSWNPLGKPGVDRKGFIVEEMPDVVKGDNMKSLDLMKFVAYINLAVQSLKSDLVLSLKEQLQVLNLLKPVLGTESVTEQETTLNRRLEVLESN